MNQSLLRVSRRSCSLLQKGRLSRVGSILSSKYTLGLQQLSSLKTFELNNKACFYHTHSFSLSDAKPIAPQDKLKNMSTLMKSHLLSSMTDTEFSSKAEQAFRELESQHFSESLKILSELNEQLFTKDKNFFREEMQALRMVYQYISFMDQIYNTLDGKHSLPLFESLLNFECFEFDHLKYEIASREIQSYLDSKFAEEKTLEYVTIKRKLAWIKFYQNYLLNGINDLKEALQVARVVHGKTSIEACYCYADLATFYIAADNSSAAEKCAKIVISLLPNRQDKSPYMEEKVAAAMVALSESVREKDPEEAIKLNTGAIKTIEKIYGRRNKKWIDAIYTLITNYDTISESCKKEESRSREYAQKAETLYNLVADMLEKNAFSNVLQLPLRQSTVDEDSYDEDLLLKIYKRRKYPLPFAIHALFGAARIVLSGESPETSIQFYEKALFYLNKEYEKDEFLLEKEFASSQLACVLALVGKTDKAKTMLTECLQRIANSVGTDNKYYSDIASFEGIMSIEGNGLPNMQGMPGMSDMFGSDKSADELKSELERFGVDVNSLTSIMEQAIKSGGPNMSEKDMFGFVTSAMAQQAEQKKKKKDEPHKKK